VAGAAEALAGDRLVQPELAGPECLVAERVVAEISRPSCVEPARRKSQSKYFLVLCLET
jgi:hypothetical protein